MIKRYFEWASLLLEWVGILCVLRKGKIQRTRPVFVLSLCEIYHFYLSKYTYYLRIISFQLQIGLHYNYSKNLRAREDKKIESRLEKFRNLPWLGTYMIDSGPCIVNKPPPQPYQGQGG